jgi:PAS domain S-box-containing protein
MLFGLSSTAVKDLVDASPVAMVLASPALNDCPMVHVNAAFLELTLFDRSQILGRNCRMLQGPGSEVAARKQLRDAVERRESAAVAITNYRRDGSMFRNFVFLHPILNREGQLQFILGSQYEISAPKPRVSLLEHAELIDRRIDMVRPMLEREAGLTFVPEPLPSLNRARRYLERHRR